MKRLIVITLVFCLFLSGCTVFGERIKEPVTFYYLRSEYQYFASDGVIASEEREAAGHRDDLSYLMALYLMGPSTDELKTPLPRGTRISQPKQTPEGIVLQLSDAAAALTDADYSLACACLALTCFDLTDANNVTINCAERSVTMSRDALSLYDDSMTATEETQ